MFTSFSAQSLCYSSSFLGIPNIANSSVILDFVHPNMEQFAPGILLVHKEVKYQKQFKLSRSLNICLHSLPLEEYWVLESSGSQHKHHKRPDWAVFPDYLPFL